MKLKDNPYVGDSLQIRVLREKRLDEKRIYYLIFDDLNAVLFVAISNKKSQQATLDWILRDINKYRDYVKELFKD